MTVSNEGPTIESPSTGYRQPKQMSWCDRPSQALHGTSPSRGGGAGTPPLVGHTILEHQHMKDNVMIAMPNSSANGRQERTEGAMSIKPHGTLRFEKQGANETGEKDMPGRNVPRLCTKSTARFRC